MISSSRFPVSTIPSPSIHKLAGTPTISRWRLRSELPGGSIIQRSTKQAFGAYANSNGSRRKKINEMIMVDPLEAKLLADKQMQEIKAKERLKRQRRIEAINGAWAMFGLTAALVVEGQTGKPILAQLSGYWEAFIAYFSR